MGITVELGVNELICDVYIIIAIIGLQPAPGDDPVRRPMSHKSNPSVADPPGLRLPACLHISHLDAASRVASRTRAVQLRIVFIPSETELLGCWKGPEAERTSVARRRPAKEMAGPLGRLGEAPSTSSGRLYFEPQQGEMCGLHALNALMQGPFFDEVRHHRLWYPAFPAPYSALPRFLSDADVPPALFLDPP